MPTPKDTAPDSSAPMIPEQRREQILRQLRKHQVMSVHQLMEMFDCSHMTVRRDIALLEQEGDDLRSQDRAFHIDGCHMGNRRNITEWLAQDVRHHPRHFLGRHENRQRPVAPARLNQALPGLQHLTNQGSISLVGVRLERRVTGTDTEANDSPIICIDWGQTQVAQRITGGIARSAPFHS